MTRVPSTLQGLPDDLLDSDNTYFRNVKTHNQDKPDFSKDSGDSFPTPDVKEAGYTLEDTDTGDRYRWTGTTWILTHLRGMAQPIDYFIEVSSGHIPGVIDVTQGARNVEIQEGVFQTLWDHTGNKKYFTEDTQLYASSTSASDVGNRIRIEGLNDQYELGITQVVLNGQTPVAIPGEFFRIREAFCDNGAPLQGDIYMAELGTTTGGVPDNPTLVQSKIPLSNFEVGDFASTNMTHNGFFTVPAGFDVHLLSLTPGTAKGDDITIDFRKREFSEQGWTSLLYDWAYSGPGPTTISNRSRIQEKADIEIRVMSGEPLGKFSAQLQFVLREKAQ